MSHLDVAVARLRAGLCVLPARLDSKRPSLGGWKPFQGRVPTEAELRLWFSTDRPMCIVTGAVSGNLEMIDFDAGGESYDAWVELLRGEAPELVDRLLVERSPSGGRHVVYRCREAVSPNLKLAQRRVVTTARDPITLQGRRHVPRNAGDRWEVVLTLIETRGEGGLFICHPSPGYELLQGDYLNVPDITSAERDLLLRAAWSLDELPAAVEPDPTPGDPCGRPGDDFNRRGDVRAVLERHGWTRVRGGENELWRRPGKEFGWSATLKGGVFYVFSSNAAPFEPNRAYSPFGVYTRLEHAGDYSAAAAALRADGFGQVAGDAPDVDLSRIAGKPASSRPPVSNSDLLVRRLMTVDHETLAWLWPGRFPLGKLTLLAGDPGLGKSFLTLDMAARVSRGAPWPDNPLLAQPVGEVVLLNAEDDLADTIAPRLEVAGADDARILAVEGVQVRDPKGNQTRRLCFSLEADLPRLEDLIAGIADVRLIVIDPVSAYCGGIDSHNNAEVRSLLAPLAELAGRHRVAVVAVTHLSKGMGQKAIYRAMGSLAFAAAARAVWTVVKDPHDPKRRLLLPAKLNVGQEPDGLAFRIVEGRVAWEADPVRMHADEAFAAEASAMSEGGTRGAARREASAWLRERLANGPQPSGQVITDAKEHGIAERTLRRAFKELGCRSRKTGSDGQWCWSLPTEDGHEDGQQDDQIPL